MPFVFNIIPYVLLFPFANNIISKNFHLVQELWCSPVMSMLQQCGGAKHITCAFLNKSLDHT